MKILFTVALKLLMISAFAQWNTSGTDIYNSNSGNVGIGTTAPRGKLDVDGPGDVYLVDDPNDGTNQRLYIPGHVFLSPYNGGDISYLQARRLNDTGTTSLRFRTWNNGVTEAMHIDPAGNVGVRNVNPTSSLDVNGNLTLRNPNNISLAGSSIHFTSFSDVNPGPMIRSVLYYAQGVDSKAGLVLSSYSEGYKDEMILRGGNVGIGTMSPDSKLTVNGAIHAKEVKVDLNVPAPDYVFEDGYELMPLSEVAAYIKKNKHLPEIPSG
ncbi:MAG TPA: hypothetical protein PLV32_15065, partial [Chitinophagaceae bacterium]|nr:hypothetical protein [Chitinophagaceae bacterium]